MPAALGRSSCQMVRSQDELITDSRGVVYFRTQDPENHAIEFVQKKDMIAAMKRTIAPQHETDPFGIRCE